MPKIIEKLDGAQIKDNVYFGGNYGAIDNIDYAGLAEESSGLPDL